MAPRAKLWYKERTSFEDLEYVLNDKKFPACVEWHGLFDDEDDDDDDDYYDYDYGRYSIIAHIDKVKDELIIVDPYKDFVDENCIIRVSTFEKRRWDYNEVKDPETGKKEFKKDEQLFS